MKALILMLALTAILFQHAVACAESTIHLSRKNSVVYMAEITQSGAEMLAQVVIQKRSGIDLTLPIYVVIDSGGGEYPASLRMKTFLAAVPNLILICKRCDSAAGMLFATFQGKRLVIQESSLMMHEMYYEYVTAKMIQDPALVKELIDSSEEFNKSMRDLMKMSRLDYQKKIEGSEWTVHGKEIVDLKLATELVKVQMDL